MGTTSSPLGSDVYDIFSLRFFPFDNLANSKFIMQLVFDTFTGMELPAPVGSFPGNRKQHGPPDIFELSSRSWRGTNIRTISALALENDRTLERSCRVPTSLEGVFTRHERRMDPNDLSREPQIPVSLTETQPDVLTKDFLLAPSNLDVSPLSHQIQECGKVANFPETIGPVSTSSPLARRAPWCF